MKKTFSLFYIYFLLASILMCIGLVFVYSASSYLAFNMHKVDSYYIFKQVAGVFLAICMFCLTLFLEVQTIKRYALFFFIISLVLCIATKLPVIGITVNGASRWISLLGIVFQPVEVLKPCSVLFFSYILSRNQYSLNRLIPLFVCVLGLIGIVLLMQPDFGHAAVILSVSIALLYLTGCRIPLLKRFLFAGGSLGVLLVFFKPYRLRRLLAFLDPWKDPQGSGFQIIQSLIAVSNGGLCGVGIGNSRQKLLYLPMQHTDFIFSIICEESGLIGGVIVITLYILFLYIGLTLAQKQEHMFNTLLISGITLTIFLQSAVNILVALGAVPTKGIGLPFISYGISALVGLGFSMGLVWRAAAG